MKFLFLILSLASSHSFAASQGEYTQVDAERSAILALTQEMEGDVFGAEVTVKSSDSEQFVLDIYFAKYHQDDSIDDMGLIPCYITVPVSKQTGAAEIQIDDNLLCFQ